MRFGELTDTDPCALEKLVAARRRMPLENRVSQALQMAGMLLSLAETGVRRIIRTLTTGKCSCASPPATSTARL